MKHCSALGGRNNNTATNDTNNTNTTRINNTINTTIKKIHRLRCSDVLKRACDGTCRLITCGARKALDCEAMLVTTSAGSCPYARKKAGKSHENPMSSSHTHTAENRQPIVCAHRQIGSMCIPHASEQPCSRRSAYTRRAPAPPGKRDASSKCCIEA
ncbi:hypothetical protein T492DRAFT_971227 [Pavlovales sp. CCMP2436]|nr:hypothetical protein T492DRAFT_971227 [Pavlovales sp. CCMP2436]